jgi:hypothetical protein
MKFSSLVMQAGAASDAYGWRRSGNSGDENSIVRGGGGLCYEVGAMIATVAEHQDSGRTHGMRLNFSGDCG